MTKKLQVFVSSTYTDLKQERQAAVAAILKSGHIPAGMELFTAGDKSQWNTIKRWIDESDVYMLILGGRYGSVEEKSNLAYTELEYNYAVETGKPFFSVVINEKALERKVMAEGTSVIETKNGVLLANFKNKVLSNISSFFSDEKDIKLCVHESLSEFAASKDLVGWVPGNSVLDSTPLFEEIAELKEEARLLRSKLAEFERRASIEGDKQVEFDELINILNSTEVAIPDDLSNQKDVKLSLLYVFNIYIDDFSTGFDNSMGMSDAYRFLFFSVAPQLKIHGLVQYEKVTGAKYRRCILTPKGEQLASEIIKRTLRATKLKGENKKETVLALETPPARVEGKKPRTKRTKPD